MFTSSPARSRPAGAATRCFRNRALGRSHPMDADSRRFGESGSGHSGFQEPAPVPESNSRARFDAATRIRWRIGREIRHSPAAAGMSGFQEPGGWPARRRIVGVSGTVRRAGWLAAPSGFQEPRPSGYREPRLTVYSEPSFVVTGTHARGFRNRRLRKSEQIQRLADFSTALNALTSFYNRISSNPTAAENTPKTPPLGGFAPAGSLRRFAATPRALTRPPTRHPPIRRRANARRVILQSRVPMIFELDNPQHRHNRRNWLSEESLAFSVENPRNRRCAASAPKRGVQTR